MCRFQTLRSSNRRILISDGQKEKEEEVGLHLFQVKAQPVILLLFCRCSLDMPFNCVSLLCSLSISACGALTACSTLYFCVAYSFIYLSVSLNASSVHPSIYLSICPGGALQFKSSSNYYSQSIIERFDLRLFHRPTRRSFFTFDASTKMRVWIMEMRNLYIYLCC